MQSGSPGGGAEEWWWSWGGGGVSERCQIFKRRSQRETHTRGDVWSVVEETSGPSGFSRTNLCGG